MISLRTAVAFGFVLLVNPAGKAEEPAARLPENGWWVRYSVTTKQDRDGNTDESTFKRTYSLTGTVAENGEKCRWVEMKSAGSVAGQERIQIAKLLVSEKDLLENEKPLSGLLRGWRKIDGGAVTPVKVDAPQAVNPLSAKQFYEKEMLIFPGMRQKSEIIDKQKTVEYQQGRLEMTQGRTGKIERKSNGALRGRNQNMTSNFEFTVWTDPVIELGFAAANIRNTTSVDNVVRSSRDDEWVIEDFGTDAKSELPENN